jgi:ribosomal protein S27AE
MSSDANILLRMWNDLAAEWRRLTEHYRSLSDQELQDLSADLNDLTEVARQVLRDEMKVRGLSEPRPATSAAPKEGEISKERGRWDLSFYDTPPAIGADEDGDESERAEFSWKTELCECETREQVWQLAEALRRAGIDRWVQGDGRRYPRIMVAADQLERARMVASQPVSRDIVDEVRQGLESRPSFEMPCCPTCGAQDPLLEPVDPANRWRCGACGRRWVEEETISPAEGKG